MKPGHTLVAVNDRSLLTLCMQECARITAEAAQKVKESQGKVPCVVRFLRTGEEDVGDAAAAATARVGARRKKSCGLLSMCVGRSTCASTPGGSVTSQHRRSDVTVT
jgi:acetylornithine deacetylase/succinyl-diaminopimelate desuccinylase-like protein